MRLTPDPSLAVIGSSHTPHTNHLPLIIRSSSDLQCGPPPPPPPPSTSAPPRLFRPPPASLPPRLPAEVIVSSSPLPSRPATQNSPQLRKPSPAPDEVRRQPGDVITEIRMEVGQGEGPSAPVKAVRGSLGRGSTVVSRGDSGTVPRSLERQPADSQLSSRPSDLVIRPTKDTLTHDADSIAPEALVEDVIVKEAYKETNSIVIRWESETTNILGFRVIYRLFGTPQFKQGPPLAPSEREFKIKNVPDNVSIVWPARPC